MIIDILKEACQQVHEKTKGLAGTTVGSRQMGRGAGGDISRRIDLIAEKTVIDVIREGGIEATIIGEECGRIEGKEGYIIIDAIDGTTNAICGIPFFCCSVAYATDFYLSAVAEAVIIDLPRGDLYYASKNKGAFLNDRRIFVKREPTSDSKMYLESHLQWLSALLQSSQRLPTSDSLAQMRWKCALLQEDS